MAFYTSKGDDGTTNLLGEGRVAKYHARIEAVGTLDEASAALGLLRPGIGDFFLLQVSFYGLALCHPLLRRTSAGKAVR